MSYFLLCQRLFRINFARDGLKNNFEALTRQAIFGTIDLAPGPNSGPGGILLALNYRADEKRSRGYRYTTCVLCLKMLAEPDVGPPNLST